MHREWFEPALARELGQVAAPEELWERVRNPVIRKKKSVHTSVNAARVGACATVILVAIGLFVGHRGLRSADAGEIRGWVKAQAGIDVPLQSRPVGVHLMGASVAKGSVEIAYRVGNRDGRLVVGGHAPSGSNGRVFTWSMDGRIYTLECATPEDLKIACNLCHIG
jgi:hypothetical protein